MVLQWSAEADLKQGPLSNVGMEGFAGVILEETHAEGCDALIRALVHISPVIQEKVHNVEVRMHLESGKDRLVNTGASPQQTGRLPAIHAAPHPWLQYSRTYTILMLGPGEGTLRYGIEK